MDDDHDATSSGAPTPTPGPSSTIPPAKLTVDDANEIPDPVLRAKVLATAHLMRVFQTRKKDSKRNRAKLAASFATSRRDSDLADEGSDDEEAVSDVDAPADISEENGVDDVEVVSLVKGLFSRGYLDEAHVAKNRRTATNQAIRLADLGFVLLSSATPAPNRITDFLAYLELAQPEDVVGNNDWIELAHSPEAAVEYYKNPEISLGAKLNPALFRFMCVNNDMLLTHAFQILPLLLGQIQLKRSIGQQMDVGTPEAPDVITIGADIPGYRMYHMLCLPRPIERLDLAQAFAALAPQLMGGGGSRIEGSSERGSKDVEDGGSLNLHVVRRLMQNSFCSTFERVSRDFGARANVDGILQSSHCADHGKHPSMAYGGTSLWGAPKNTVLPAADFSRRCHAAAAGHVY